MFMRMKTVGLALLALSALAGTSAGAASAKVVHDFRSSASPAIITGEGSEMKFEFGPGWTLSCKGNKVNGTVKEFPASSVTVQFTHSECGLNSLAATVDSEHCKYKFTGETDETEHAKVDLECESATTLRVTVNGCTIEIPEQSFERGATYKNTAETGKKKDVDVTVTSEKGLYTKTGLLCSTIGGTGSDLSVHGTYTMQAYEDNLGKEGNQADFWTEATVLP